MRKESWSINPPVITELLLCLMCRKKYIKCVKPPSKPVRRLDDQSCWILSAEPLEFYRNTGKNVIRPKGRSSIWAIFLVCSVPTNTDQSNMPLCLICTSRSFYLKKWVEFWFTPLTTEQLEEPLHVQQGERYQKKLTVAIREPMAFDKTRLGMINLANEVCLWKLLTLKPLKAFTSACGSW